MQAKASGGNFFKRHARVIIASIALVGGLGWVLNSGALPLLPPRGTLDALELWPFVGFVFWMVLHMVLRAGRSWFLLAPIANVPLGRILVINGIANALVTFLPFRLGEFSRPAMLREKGKLSAGAITGTVGAERILDGLVFSALLLIGLWYAHPHEPLPDRVGGLPISAAIVPRAGQIASLGFAAAFCAMVLFYSRRALARSLVERVLGLVSHSFAKKIADLMERLSDGLKFLSNLRHAGPYLLVTLVAVAMHVWAIDLLAESVGIPELTFAQSAVVVGVLALGFAMPNAPGFFGTVQLALYAGLAVYVEPGKIAHEGAALVFLFYVTYLGIIIAGAILGLLIESRRTALAEAQPTDPPDLKTST